MAQMEKTVEDEAKSGIIYASLCMRVRKHFIYDVPTF